MALHRAAAAVLEEVASGRSSVKTAVYSSDWRSKGVLSLVVVETLKYRDVIDKVFAASGIKKKEKRLAKICGSWILRLLLWEMLLGKGIQGKNQTEKLLLRHKTLLKAEFARLKVKRGAKSNNELVASTTMTTTIPRYVRVNTIRLSMEDAVKDFLLQGFSLLPTPDDFDSFISAIDDLGSKDFIKDFHMNEFLLIFAPGTDLRLTSLYRSGGIIFQDKASCLPPFLLAPPPSSLVVDACAAPGNKATLAAALMSNRGRVVAFDVDASRCETMKMMTKKAGALKEGGGGGCVSIRNEDFLVSSPENDAELSSAEFILVDPSCSGSGIQSRLDHLTNFSNSTRSASRLLRLQAFQLDALLHALLRFPRARRVVYSTCSVEEAENEAVVGRALAAAKGRGWRLAEAMEGDWKTRGKTTSRAEEEEDCSFQNCLRSLPETERTNGFFVALFVRDSEEETESATRKEAAKGLQSGPQSGL